MKLTYLNPLTINEESIDVKDYKVDNYIKFKNLIEFHNDGDIIKILKDYLHKLDCSRTCEGMTIIKINDFNYSNYMSQYMFYLKFITNYKIYNFYYDELIGIHVTNILYEYNNPINKIEKVKAKVKKNKKTKAKNEFVKHTTTDLFTNEIVYIYENLVTGEKVESSNPNLLDELNKPKVKKKKEKISKVVSLNCMTFSFKKK